ncbi:MAG: hypothetical protein K6B28_11835 [Lachnospiraceae bacterium]|nr:hypothetical protein [Lachnospiraceae bacterium]
MESKEKNDRHIRMSERDERIRRYHEEREIIKRNRQKKLEGNERGKYIRKRISVVVISILSILIPTLILQFVIPGSLLKRKEADAISDPVITPTVVSLEVIAIPQKEYAGYSGISEEQRIWDVLMEHFEGNKTAVLGVMCNLKSESGFEAKNLEDYNNRFWNIEDDIYTEKVNTRLVSMKDFIESRHMDSTNGYYNKYDEWVNRDGGYGYAQYTAYDRKEDLYLYAEQWFGPGGPGEEYRFDIGDPNMQAHYIVNLLRSEEFSSLNKRLMSASSVVDACYLWLKKYEIPYDPYNDDYYTLAFERAACADKIREACDKVSIDIQADNGERDVP